MIIEALTAVLNFQFTDPILLLGIPIALLLMIFILSFTFFKMKVDPEEAKRMKRKRVWIGVSRLIIISLVLIALAQPYGERTTDAQGDPRLTVLLDKSGSMEYLDTGLVEELLSALEKRVPTTIRTIGTNLSSDLGNSMLQNLDPGGNILLVSDGNPNKGPKLEDVAFYAATINTTISSLNLSSRDIENSVLVTGPTKVMADSDVTFDVKVSSTDPTSRVRLTVSIDGNEVLNKEVSPGTFTFTKQFSEGSHKLEATLLSPDDNSENNKYYKQITVLSKPRILLVSQKSSPVELLLRELYDVEKRSSLPNDLSPYYAIIANDVPVENMRNTQQLHDFLIDEAGDYYGGGLLFLGGLNSFDRGDYHGSSLEPILPVRVGKGERKRGEASLVFVIDVSGSAAKTKYRMEQGRLVAYEEAVPTMDIIKAQIMDAVENLKLDNKVGIIVFGVPAKIGVSEYGSTDEMIADTVRVVEPLDYLYNNRKNILEKVPRVIGGGPSSAAIAFKGAIDMLRYQSGDKNIILMSDGRYSAGLGAESPQKREMLTLASNARKLYGINFMTIGVGTTSQAEFEKKVDEVFMKELAVAGDGTYDRATRLNTLLVKWGDPKAKQFGEEFFLVPLSLTHFITRNTEPDAVLNAYNEVVPKDTAELLITSDSGNPALTTWRYGNGRVGTWTVFAGNNLGQLLTEGNSVLLSRSVNWAIGDPQRKEAYYVEVPDVRSNEEGRVIVKSDQTVTSDALDFTKEGDTYVATFLPTTLGWGTIMNTVYGINRPSEFDQVGLNPAIESIVESTGGKVFKVSDADEIVEHVKEASRRTIIQREVLALPFLWAALGVLLLEILFRRITERRQRQ
jgi:hypothetical protein